MIKKIILAIKTIINLHVLVLDYLGFKKGDIVYQLRSGLSMVARGGTSDYAEIIINAGDFEYPSYYYPKNLSPVIVDIGANIGDSTLYIYKKLERNNPQIYAVEPNSSNYTYLLRNIKLNKIKNINTYKIAITGKTGFGKIAFDGKRYDGGFTDNIIQETKSLKSERISTMTFVDFCQANKIKIVDLIKIDIEGSEYEAIRASINFIRRNVRSMFIELHKMNEVDNYEGFNKYITKQGFTVKKEIMNRTIFVTNDRFNYQQ